MERLEEVGAAALMLAVARRQTYQLWALGGEQPISAGVLGADPRIVAFTVDPRATGLAISAERAGGVVRPNLPPVAAGEVRTTV
jgi:hypothetical protein